MPRPSFSVSFFFCFGAWPHACLLSVFDSALGNSGLPVCFSASPTETLSTALLLLLLAALHLACSHCAFFAHPQRTLCVIIFFAYQLPSWSPLPSNFEWAQRVQVQPFLCPVQTTLRSPFLLTNKRCHLLCYSSETITWDLKGLPVL